MTRHYGRKLARPMRRGALEIYDTLYPEFQWTPGQPLVQPICLEIGFGMGDFLIHQAQLFPEKMFIGVEPFKTGVVGLLRKIQTYDLKNIRIHHGVIDDVIDQLPDLLNIYILYPDPWPKKRHNKRRLIQKDFLQKLSQRLAPQGTIHIASDHADYQVWIKDVIQNLDTLRFDLSKCAQPFAHWTPTKYEKKAIEEGRIPQYFHGEFTN